MIENSVKSRKSKKDFSYSNGVDKQHRQKPLTTMPDTALTTYQFTIDKAIAEWLEQKRLRTGSQKTYDAYRETMQSFRLMLSHGNIDLLDNPTDVQRLAAIWANTRNGQMRRPGEDVSPSTYNQRLAILSSFYTFLQEVYHLDIPNPIESVKKWPVQAYAAAPSPIEPETVEQGLLNINRATLQGLRDYAILAVALATGRRAHELVTLRFEHMKITGGKKEQRVTLTFAHCKGNKQMRDNSTEKHHRVAGISACPTREEPATSAR